MQKIESDEVDVYLLGYTLDEPTTNYRSIGTAPDYVTGSVSTTNNSPIVDGVGTSWLTSPGRGRCDVISICDQTPPPTCTTSTNIARGFAPLSQAERTTLVARAREAASDGRLEPFKSTQAFDGPHHQRQHGFRA